ncbi:MAG: ABC transporter substrate-binding protein [Pseudomonadota bacterium]
MTLIHRTVLAAAIALGALPAVAQDLTIAATFGPTAEVPDPREGYNGWMSNQMGVTETLMGIGYDLSLYPRLAEGIEQAGPTTWRVTLREGLSFHDGTPVTAQAAVDAISAISAAEGPGSNARVAALMDLAGLSADGDRVIVFETNAPNAAFPFTLSDPGIAILGPSSDDFPINATGPYIFQEAVPDQTYTVTANADYRQGAPGLDSVTFTTAPDPSAAALAFEAGEVDMVVNYPEADFARIQGTGAQGFASPTARLYFYTANARSGPMANPLIRRAVSHAIDRQGIVDAVLEGVGGAAADTIFPEDFAWTAETATPYDPAEAERLLAEAGAVKQGGIWMLDGAPLEIDIVTYASRAPLPPTAALTQAFLQAIGVQANVRTGEYGAMNDAIAAEEADLFLQAWVTTPQGDPGAVLEMLIGTEGDSNAGGYSNAALDELLAGGRTQFEQAEREAIYDQVQEIVAEEAPLIPVFHVSQVVVAVPELRGFQVHPTETYWITHETTLAE